MKWKILNIRLIRKSGAVDWKSPNKWTREFCFENCINENLISHIPGKVCWIYDCFLFFTNAVISFIHLLVHLFLKKDFRSSITSRAEAFSRTSNNNLKCVTCGQTQINEVHLKYRICESDSSAKFRETLFLQDVYTRTCDSSKVFGADLYYHRVWLPAHANKYNRATNQNNNKTKVKTTKKTLLICMYNFSKVYLIQELLLSFFVK